MSRAKTNETRMDLARMNSARMNSDRCNRFLKFRLVSLTLVVSTAICNASGTAKQPLAQRNLAIAHATGLALAKTTQSKAVNKTESLSDKSTVIRMISGNYAQTELLNPLNNLWKELPQTKLDLFPQNIVTPHGGGSVKDIYVRSLRNQLGVAFQLEWADATKDNDTIHQVNFRDGVAIEFPIDKDKDTVLAMGHPNGPVDIWHWKADWEPDAPYMNTAPYNQGQSLSSHGPTIYNRLQVDSTKEPNAAQGPNGPTSGLHNLFPPFAHKSPVEDIIAIGISSITSKPEPYQNLNGRGVWKEGKWYVSIFKPLDPSDKACPKFNRGDRLNTAFAVWNGAHQERNGMKSISNWAVLKCN